MHLLKIAAFSGLVPVALARMSVVSPASRNQVGPALKAECGQSISDYLAAHPGADHADIRAAQGAGYECNLDRCAGYQLADNLNNIVTIHSSQPTNFTVNLTIPDITYPPEVYYWNYAPVLTFERGGVAQAIGYGYGLFNGSTEVLKYPAINQLGEDNYGLQPGDCSKVGECLMTIQLVNHYRSLYYGTSRVLSSACVDLKVVWD